MSEPIMIASVLHLSHKDIKALKLNNWKTFDYTLHKVVYQLFEDKRSLEDKQKSVPSGFLYADKGADKQGRKILLLSNRQPIAPEQGDLRSKKIADSFLDYEHYRFEVIINPTKRDNKTGSLNAIQAPKEVKTNRTEITQQKIALWFIEKAPHWGFTVSEQYLEVCEVEVKQFKKGTHDLTQAQAKVLGCLTVTDKARFIKSFQQGIGRGRAFGCGLLQIVPL